MGNPATLYRFKIALSDVDRAVYEALDLRVGLHPSETESSMLTRVLAYALNVESGLVFSQGIGTPDDPAIQLADPRGGIAKWIDVGNPSARRMHKAAKAARLVRVYTYKDPEILKREGNSETVHRADEIEIFAFEPAFMKRLAEVLKRDNTWELMHNEGELVVTAGKETVMGTMSAHRLEAQR